MLTDRQMEYISDALVPLFQYLESEVISDVAQRVKATIAFTRTAELEAQALYELGYSPAAIRKKVMKKLNADSEYRKLVAKNTLEHKNKVKKLLRDIQKEAYKAGEKLFAQSGDLSFLDDLRIWKLGNKEITDSSFLPKLVKAMEMQTRGELKNLTRTTGFKTMAGMESLQTVYRKELDQAVIKIATGTFSQEQVIYDVIHNLANSGLRSIDYKTGRTMQLDSAVRLATRTGTHQLMGKIAEQNIRETDTDMVYVSSHWGARNTGQGHANHAKWQGQVYRTGSSITEGDAKKEAERIGQSEIKDLWEATGYCMDGTHENDPKGLYGYNCRHRIYPWFIGVSSLPDEEPEPEPVTIDGKQYDYYAMSQKQRAKESRIRALKREREAMQKLGMDTKEVQKKIKDKIKEYEQFCKDYNMPEKYNRIRYDNGTGEYKKTKAWREYEEKHKADMENALRNESGLQKSVHDDKIKFNSRAQKTDRTNPMDITKEWTDTSKLNGIVVERQEYIINGVTYKMDGKHVTLKPSQQERNIAEMLSSKYGKKVELVPQVLYPQGIQTPDYLIDGERFDLKTPIGIGKNLLYGLIAKKKKQSNNFILDITNCPLSIEELERQVEDLYRSPRVGFLEKVVFVKNDGVIKVISRG